MKFIGLLICLHAMNFNKIHKDKYEGFNQKYYNIALITEIREEKRYKVGFKPDDDNYSRCPGCINYYDDDVCEIVLDGQIAEVYESCDKLIDRINGLK